MPAPSWPWRMDRDYLCPRSMGPTRMRAGLFLAAPLLIAACLREAPLVEPGRIYDPQELLQPSRYAELDSLVITLVGSRDSTRIIPVWRGHPDTLGRLPIHIARK